MLEATVAVPVLVKNEVVGLAGIDFTLGALQNLAQINNSFTTLEPIIIANDGVIVSHKDSTRIGSLITENSFNNTGVNVLDSISSGATFSFSTHMTDEDRYYTFAPIYIGNSTTPWSVCVSVPYKEVLVTANKISKVSHVYALIC